MDTLNVFFNSYLNYLHLYTTFTITGIRIISTLFRTIVVMFLTSCIYMRDRKLILDISERILKIGKMQKKRKFSEKKHVLKARKKCVNISEEWRWGSMKCTFHFQDIQLKSLNVERSVGRIKTRNYIKKSQFSNIYVSKVATFQIQKKKTKKNVFKHYFLPALWDKFLLSFYGNKHKQMKVSLKENAKSFRFNLELFKKDCKLSLK